MAPKLLIVDDDPKWLRIVSLYFTGRSYRVTSALNADDALTAIEDDRPDLIIADIVMPGLDGYELCRRVRRTAATRTIPFIFLTGRDEDRDKAKARKVGADDYLTKPCPLDRLAQRVEAAMDRIEQARRLPVADIGLSGRIEAVNLLDLIQTIELEQKTGALVLSHGERIGTLYFRDGTIVRADIQSPKRDEPLFVLLGWKTGRFVFVPDSVPERTPITASVANVLIDDLRTLEAQERSEPAQAPGAADDPGPTGPVLGTLEEVGRVVHETLGPSRRTPAVLRVLVVGVAHSGKSAFIEGLVRDFSAASRWAAIGIEEPAGAYRTDFGRVRVSSATVLHLIAVRAEKRFFGLWEEYLPRALAAIVLCDPASDPVLGHVRAFLQARRTLTPALPAHVMFSSGVPGDDATPGAVAGLPGIGAGDRSWGLPSDQTARLQALDGVLKRWLDRCAAQAPHK
jgi:DNA-binding response OmpR family regulator